MDNPEVGPKAPHPKDAALFEKIDQVVEEWRVLDHELAVQGTHNEAIRLRHEQNGD